MTTVTLIIYDLDGANSNALFPSSAPYDVSGTVRQSDGTRASLNFYRYKNGIVDDSAVYQLSMTGSGFASTGSVDLTGNVDFLTLSSAPDAFGTFTRIMEASFTSIDGGWEALSRVTIESIASLTPDVLMGRIMQRSPANFFVIGNNGNDILNGSFLNDTMRGGAGADTLFGGEGLDTASYEGSGAPVRINLATGVVTGGHGAGDRLNSVENIIASFGNDTVTGDGNANVIDGLPGFDIIRGGGGNDGIFGRDGGGTLFGDAGNDRVDGGKDNDTIYGGLGEDELRVGTGNNFADGEAGNDFVLGDSGRDRLLGSEGNDQLVGTSGADTLDGGLGADTMSGDMGASQYFVDNSADVVIDDALDDGDRVLASVTYTLTGGSAVEFLATTNANGTAAINLTGNELAQQISGNGGANVLNGAAGRDTLLGGAGNDTLSGGLGADTLIGGLGNDVYDYNTIAQSGTVAAALDRITGFRLNADRIDLSTIDAIPGGANNGFAFKGTAPFDAPGQVRVAQSGVDTIVSLNTIGTSGSEMMILLKGITATTLDAGEFVL